MWGTVMTGLINLMEETVLNKIDQLWENTDYCKCDCCRMDVATYALNRLPPQYVQSLKGKVLYSTDAFIEHAARVATAARAAAKSVFVKSFINSIVGE